MKKMAYFVGGIAVAVSVAGIAGSLTVPNNFTENTVISSSEMNANFTAVKDAVDDNDGRITTLEGKVSTLENLTCPTDMVQVGPICVDKYEASVWDAETGGTQVTDLTTACNANGSDCTGIYALSAPDFAPATNITWFQAQQACANVGKRLLTNAEWQMAAAGTDPAACNTGGSIANTGADHDSDTNTDCKSSSGVFDMVGNVAELVADWAHHSKVATHDMSTPVPSSEFVPNAIYRGGDYGDGTSANILTYFANSITPLEGAPNAGFRCAK